MVTNTSSRKQNDRKGVRVWQDAEEPRTAALLKRLVDGMCKICTPRCDVKATREGPILPRSATEIYVDVDRPALMAVD